MRAMAKPITYPFVFAASFSAEDGAWFSEAGENGFAGISISRLIRAGVTQLRVQHRHLTSQGYRPLDATLYLLRQIEAKPAQPPAPPQPAPSPFAEQPPMRAANGR
jgi:hypothetical protein